MIKPVSLVNFYNNKSINLKHTNPIHTTELPIIKTNQIQDTVSFTGGEKKKLDEMLSESKMSAANILERGQEIAKQYGSREVKEEHTLLACLEVLDKYIEDLDSGATYYGAEKSSDLTSFWEDIFDSNVFKKQEKRSKIKPIVKEEIQILTDKIKKEGKRGIRLTSPKINPDHLSTMYAIWKQACYDEDMPFSDMYILNASMYPDNDKYLQEVALPFRRKLQEALMLDGTKLDEKPHLRFYDDKARNVWKNLAVGTNMFVLHDKNVNPQYLLNSFHHIIDEGEKFDKLNKENIEIVAFNNNVSGDYISHKIRKSLNDKGKTYVFIVPTEKHGFVFSSSLEETFKNPPRKSKFVIVSDKDDYYKHVDPQDDENAFLDYGEVTVPIMNAEQAKKVFKEEKGLMKKITKPFEPEAIDRCVEVSAGLPGNYPEKTQKIMNLMASYYIDKEEPITADDVDAYVKQATEVFKTVDDDSSVIVSLDTGKKLDDMVGAKGTRQEAQSIIRRIKDKTIGTKGYTIYSQDGYPGAGRRHTAQVIAGEAKVPYIEINAMDFGTKDVDLFGSGGLTPEASMKKLFSLVKSQAETNESKSAVLFIENFEYFSVGEQVSEYHQKAMSQLIREMTNAEKQGLNIVVMGSMSDPRMIGNSTLKSFKFIDEIEVESPSDNSQSRREILEYYIKEKGIKISGETKEEQDEIIRSASETTEGFPLVHLIAYLDKAQNIAKERGRDKIQKEDFIESYLQITTGRPSYRKFPEYSREITCAHEGGHAIVTQLMDEIINENGNNKPWQKSLKVNFIALDPRSTYLGAVYHKDIEDGMMTLYDILSYMAVTFGGNSSEKLLYDFDGSWGITADMQQMTHMARTAIQYCGLGPNVGKMTVADNMLGNLDLSPSMREKFDKDFEVFSKNANLISDKIVLAYSDFVREFAQKYKNKVGTGDCLISSEQFKQELNEWRDRQTPEKKEELANLNKEIVNIMEQTRKGILVNENK